MPHDSAAQFSKSLSEYIFRRYGTLEECTEVCSPIEAMMYFAISAVSEFRDGIYLTIHTQHEIGNYRVDFMIIARSDALNNPGLNARVIVECDGHDFHEKTKEQARRDKQRDRFLQAKGFHILRFTGSEIWEDCLRKAEEVLDFLESQIEKQGDEAYCRAGVK